ncbi:MAG: hypothetical protein ABIZ04_00115 [Opitutus sp.]
MKFPPLVHVSWLGLAIMSLHTPVAAQSAPLPNVTLVPSETITLWPGKPPGETVAVGVEHVVPERPRPFDQITDVSVPTLAVCLPPKEKRTGTAMLVLPGGGLERLAIEHEGFEVAEWLNEHGIAAFILKYRVPARGPGKPWTVGLQDAQRAMGIIRSRADEWGVDRDAIGAIGFSAGAAINVPLSLFTTQREYAPIDAADALSSRPDFNIAMYGGGFADVSSNQLQSDLVARITKDTPPMFIVHAFDDAALSSIILMNALKRANVPSELHVFAAGAHGFGVRDSGLPVGQWRELLLSWLRWQGWLDARSVRAYANAFVAEREHAPAKLQRLSQAAPEADMEAAFAAQRRIVRRALEKGDEIVGYKGAFTSSAAQARMHVKGPLHGVLLKSGRVEASNSDVITVKADQPILVETELGYVMAVDMGSKLRVPAQAMSAVESIRPVIELPDDFSARMDGGATGLDSVAMNVGSRRFIVGAALAPKVIGNPDTVKVALTLDGQVLHSGVGSEVDGGQATNLMKLINQIIDEGHVIHRGDVIICGSLGGAKPGKPGSYVADYGAVGVIKFRIQ